MHKLVKVSEFVSGMWELFRSLGFTSTFALLYCLLFSVVLLFFSYWSVIFIVHRVEKNTLFLIIFSSRAFSGVLHHKLYFLNVVWITITPFAWVLILTAYFWSQSHAIEKCIDQFCEKCFSHSEINSQGADNQQYSNSMVILRWVFRFMSRISLEYAFIDHKNTYYKVFLYFKFPSITARSKWSWVHDEITE